MARRGHARGGPRAARLLPGARLGGEGPRHAPGRRLTQAGRSGGLPGTFVTIEGPDFSGKSTLARGLGPGLAAAGVEAYFTREPGGTPVAERIRGILLDPAAEMDPWTEAYLYAAARSDHARREILPRLRRGETVVCERYLDSSVAYQGYGRGLGAEAVRDLNAWAVGEVVPDLTFLLSLPEGERERRARGRGLPLDRIEGEGGEFMRRVERGFADIARREPGRVVRLDATLGPESLAEAVVERILGLPYTRPEGP